MLSFKILNVLAIVVVICFAALIAMQYLEISFYAESPSAWAAGH